MKRNIDINELKKIEIELLVVFSDYCYKHGLTFFLAYGTLIGAIRHKGFIPWDDDIDIMMPRYDYEILIKHFNFDNTINGIKVISHKLDRQYYLPFAKVVNTSTVLKEKIDSDYEIGVYIDIFPLENLADDYRLAKKRMRKGFSFDEKLMLKTISIDPRRSIFKNFILRLGKVALRGKSIYQIIEELDSFCKETSSKEYLAFVGVICGISAGNETRVFRREWFQSSTLVEFEKRMYPVPIGYDSMLRQLYGNYMQLPPKEQQVTHHVFEAWYK